MRLVVALGGNALLPRGRSLGFRVQQESAALAASALAPIAHAHQVVVTHGNGPQVGLLALQMEAYPQGGDYPLDVLVAESEGMIGYILETELDHVVDQEVVTILTRVVVEGDDPAFTRPTKPIGPIYPDSPEVRAEAARRGWVLARDTGGLRRVVASPDPKRVIQAGLIRSLVDRRILVICGGGGGVPVIEENGRVHGVEAVIDKDLTSALLAIELGADLLLCLTDVSAVVEGWGTPHARGIRRMSPTQARGQEFAAGSMGPKVEAACRFVEATGRQAVIASLGDAERAAAGQAGTTIDPSPAAMELYPDLGAVRL